MSMQPYKVKLEITGNPGLVVAVPIEANSEDDAKIAAKAIFQEKKVAIVKS